MKGEARLNLGCGVEPREGYVNLDMRSLPGVDLVWDLRVFPWPFADRAFAEVFASHVLEHLPDLPRTLVEIARVLQPGGILSVLVPHWEHENAFTDPSHVRAFTPRSMDYWCDTELHSKQAHLYPLLFRKRAVNVRTAPRPLSWAPWPVRALFPPRPVEIHYVLEALSTSATDESV